MKYLILVTLGLVGSMHQPTDPVHVRGGALRGIISKDGMYAQYLGVPYARTDTANRFQAPLPLQPWNGIFDAINGHVRCAQRLSSNKQIIIGDENCLTLNIHKPLHTTGSVPVMVFIHGGGFREGSNTLLLYGPEYLVKKGVILVTINYRVEVLGFLCLGTKEAPGNAGLKDQVAALKWIQDNIAAFGGDPDNVTIFGESAGGASVSYHMLSPMSKGLFHKAIMQSGTSITPWSLQYTPIKTASALAKQMGFNTEDVHEIYKLFMNKTYMELLKTRVPREEGNIIFSETIFVPCVEKIVPGVEPFLTDAPYKLLKEGKFNNIPTMLGYNSAEGYMFLSRENDTTIPNIDIYTSMPNDLEFPTKEERREAADETKKLYLGNDKISKKTLLNLAGFYGDPFLKYPVIATIDLMLKTNTLPVYSYKFSYDGWLNVAKLFYGYRKEPGATHADDLFYLFNTPIPGLYRLEHRIIDQMTTMWTNFAKVGNPTPATSSLLPTPWLPTEQHDPHVFVIDKEFSTAPLFDTNSKFWHDIYMKYRRL